MLASVVAAVSQLQTPVGLSESLSGLSEASEEERSFAIRLLLPMALAAALPAEPVWAQVDDIEWWRRTLPKLSDEHLDLLLRTLRVLHATAEGDRFLRFPHRLAEACLAAAAGSSQRSKLLLFTVLAAGAADTRSAILRLMQGEHGRELADEAERWRSWLVQVQPFLPPWLAARTRTLTSALHVV